MRQLIRRLPLCATDVIRVVFDTVIFVRALLNPRGVCGRIIFGPRDRYQPIVSTPLVIEILQVLARDELVGKVERRRGAYVHVLAGLLESFGRAESVNLGDIPPISRDPKDDKVLATAVAGSADYLVSEDQDLLVLESYRGTRIVDAATFLDLLG